MIKQHSKYLLFSILHKILCTTQFFTNVFPISLCSLVFETLRKQKAKDHDNLLHDNLLIDFFCRIK